MARVDEAAEDRHQHTIIVSCNVECPECETVWDQDFDTGEFEEEMITDAPSMTVVCPNRDCAHAWEQAWEGYVAHGDAG